MVELSSTFLKSGSLGRICDKFREQRISAARAWRLSCIWVEVSIGIVLGVKSENTAGMLWRGGGS